MGLHTFTAGAAKENGGVVVRRKKKNDKATGLWEAYLCASKTFCICGGKGATIFLSGLPGRLISTEWLCRWIFGV